MTSMLSSKAVVPVIAAMMLILVAVSASLMIYTWIMSNPLPEQTVSKKLISTFKIADVSYNPSKEQLLIHVINTGGYSLSLDSVYIFNYKGKLTEYITLEPTVELEPGELKLLKINNIALSLAYPYTIKIVSQEGVSSTTTTFIQTTPPPIKHYHSIVAYVVKDQVIVDEFNGSMWLNVHSERFRGIIRNIAVVTSPNASRPYETIIVVLYQTFIDPRLYRVESLIWDGIGWSKYEVDSFYLAYEDKIGRASMDIAYEYSTGRALLVYPFSPNTRDIMLKYSIWNGEKWVEGEILKVEKAPHAYHHVQLESNKLSNEISLVFEMQFDRDLIAHGYLWNGKEWIYDTPIGIDRGVKVSEVFPNAIDVISKAISVSYESKSNRAVFIWWDFERRILTGVVWDGVDWIKIDHVRPPDFVFWVSTYPNPENDNIMTLLMGGHRTLAYTIWDGKELSEPLFVNDRIELDTLCFKCADFSWNPRGDRGIAVWGDVKSAGFLYSIWDGKKWSSPEEVKTFHEVQLWMHLERNPGSYEEVLSLMVNMEGFEKDDPKLLTTFKWNETGVYPVDEGLITDVLFGDSRAVYLPYDFRFRLSPE